MGGGGHVEEALVDLTGGVAGRFYTADVTWIAPRQVLCRVEVAPDRLFLYIYTLQSDALFVCHAGL